MKKKAVPIDMDDRLRDGLEKAFIAAIKKVADRDDLKPIKSRMPNHLKDLAKQINQEVFNVDAMFDDLLDDIKLNEPFVDFNINTRDGLKDE